MAIERERCAALSMKLARGRDAGLLTYCIENSVNADEIEHFRARYEEMGGDEDILK